MLDAKLAGETLTRPEPAPEAPVIDLMEALRQSVAEVKDRKSGGTGAKAKAAPKKTKATPSESGSRTRRAPARKS
jgi:non-homologous end joining protein Ku